MLNRRTDVRLLRSHGALRPAQGRRVNPGSLNVQRYIQPYRATTPAERGMFELVEDFGDRLGIGQGERRFGDRLDNRHDVGFLNAQHAQAGTGFKVGTLDLARNEEYRR
ncbi:hypothetical protein D3C76_1011770 [compost metagenome]